MTIPVTWLDETQVNTTPLPFSVGLSSELKLVQLTNGNLLIAWRSEANSGAGAPLGSDIIGRILNPLGEPVSSEFRLNASKSAGNEFGADIAATANGGFVVVYESILDQTRTLHLDQFGSNGVATAALPTPLATTSNAGVSTNPYFEAEISAGSDFNFLVTYRNQFTSGNSSLRQFFTTYNSLSNTQTETIVTPSSSILIDTISLNDGRFVTLSQSRSNSSNASFVYSVDLTNVQRDNIVSGSQFYSDRGQNGFNRFIDPARAENSPPAIVSLVGGGFATVSTLEYYVREGLSIIVGGYDFTVRTFNNAGVQTGTGDFRAVGPQSTNIAEPPTLAALPNGNFELVYRDPRGSLHAIDFSSTAVNLGETVFASRPLLAAIDGITPVTVGLADGRFAVAWTTAAGNSNNIVLEILDTQTTADVVPVYSIPGQFGTVNDDSLTLAVASTYIAAGPGNDSLTGTLLASRLIGGSGDDTYIIQTEFDTIVERANGGHDVIRTRTGHLDIPDNVEDAVFVSFGTTIIGGNALNNRITGGISYDVLVGFGGNDTLVGGTGAANELIGGIGDDVYVSNAVGDSIVELVGGGIDRIETALPIYVLRNQVENLLFNGSVGFLGIGNELDNVITGGIARDDLYGRNGNDIITGGGGAANTLLGNVGDDIFIVAAVGDSVVEYVNEGTDRVETALASYRLPANVEQLTYTGSGDFIGFGSDSDNIITGRAGADSLFGFGGNDRLISGVGAADTLVGGSGDDVYVTNIGSSIVELANEGVDTIEVIAVNYTITAANVEILRYVGLNDFRGTGNDLDNVIYGAGGNDILRGLGGADLIFGNAGNDQIYGGSGAADTLFGGLGNDVYFIDVAGTSVFEGVNEGSDQIATTASSFTLPENVEVLRYIGGSGFTGTGSNGNDIISGGGLSDTLSGGFGDDVIVGKSGADTLSGGAGIDQFRYNGGELGNDRILDFTPGTDKIVLATPSLDNAGFNRTLNLALVQGAGANAASSADATFIYDSVSGLLSYDADGSRVGGIISLAVLPTGLMLSIGDFLFV